MGAERREVLFDVAQALEALRIKNPMNGDGSNYMLDKALAAVMRVAGDSTQPVEAGIRHARSERAAADAELHERLERLNAHVRPAPLAALTTDPSEGES